MSNYINVDKYLKYARDILSKNDYYFVDYSKKVLRSYNNTTRVMHYSAPAVGYENMQIDFVEHGVVTDFFERINCTSNFVRYCYSFYGVDLNQPLNDPDFVLYNKIVYFVYLNQNIFFTKNGNFRQRNKFAISVLKKFIDENSN